VTDLQIGIALAVVGAGGTLAALGVIAAGIALLHRIFPPETEQKQQ